MDVHVINVEEESDHQAQSDDGYAEPSDSDIHNAQNLQPRKHFIRELDLFQVVSRMYPSMGITILIRILVRC
jgi:hypothetical protein